MSRAACALAVILAGLVTVNGCRPGDSPPVTITSPNAAALEARIAKLEADFRAVAADRDAARKERDSALVARDAARGAAADFESRWHAEQANATVLTKSRDALTASLRQRTADHELTTTQLDTLKSGLRNLLAILDGPPPSAATGPLSLIRPAR
jgi:outer membrane murein-binding lipoprotein Lpp